MIQIRNNCFETNSSSTHCISLVKNKIPYSRELSLDNEGYVTVDLIGFCSNCVYVFPEEKLAYVMLIYAGKNGISLNCYGTELREALEEFYKTDDFLALQDSIICKLGPSCKGIRFSADSSWGYIDDSYDARDEFCTYKEYDPIEFIFEDYILSYEYDG